MDDLKGEIHRQLMQLPLYKLENITEGLLSSLPFPAEINELAGYVTLGGQSDP